MSTINTINTINRDELNVLITNPNLVLLEALNEAAYQQGHLPGARLFPMGSARERATTVAARKDAPIVVYCASETCKNSDAVAKVLSDVGYSNVRVYKGGKADWQAAGLPLERGGSGASSVPGAGRARIDL
ncbi:MAG TPA: rhodanese-like domain-containing protein [Kofleriaceae bacterium]